MLTIEKYNSCEKEGKKYLSNRFIEAFQPEDFQATGYPTQIYSETEIYKYLDSMHEGRVRYYYEDSGYAPTYEEFEMIKDITRDIYQFSLNKYNKGIIVKAPMLCSMDVLRRIRNLTKTEKLPTIFEIGGGNGVLGIMLYKSGYKYISTDITQAFYLTQNNLWEGLFPNIVNECMDSLEGLNEIVNQKILHIPYWKLWDLRNSDLEADIVVSNHNLAEMNIHSLRFYLQYGKRLLRNSSYKLFIAQSAGSLFTKGTWDYLLWAFDEMGYSLLYIDESYVICCLKEKENITPIDIQEVLKKANTKFGRFPVFKNTNDKTAADFVAANQKVDAMEKVSLNEIEAFFHSLDNIYDSPDEEFMHYIDALKRHRKRVPKSRSINYAKILEFFRQNSDKNITLYGAGEECNLLLNELYKNNMEVLVNHIYDSNIERAGTKYRGYDILYPTKQKLKDVDIVFISSTKYAKDIHSFLLDQDVKKEKIYIITDYLDN